MKNNNNNKKPSSEFLNKKRTKSEEKLNGINISEKDEDKGIPKVKKQNKNEISNNKNQKITNLFSKISYDKKAYACKTIHKNSLTANEFFIEVESDLEKNENLKNKENKINLEKQENKEEKEKLNNLNNEQKINIINEELPIEIDFSNENLKNANLNLNETLKVESKVDEKDKSQIKITKNNNKASNIKLSNKSIDNDSTKINNNNNILSFFSKAENKNNKNTYTAANDLNSVKNEITINPNKREIKLSSNSAFKSLIPMEEKQTNSKINNISNNISSNIKCKSNKNKSSNSNSKSTTRSKANEKDKNNADILQIKSLANKNKKVNNSKKDLIKNLKMNNNKKLSLIANTSICSNNPLDNKNFEADSLLFNNNANKKHKDLQNNLNNYCEIYNDKYNLETIFTANNLDTKILDSFFDFELYEEKKKFLFLNSEKNKINNKNNNNNKYKNQSFVKIKESQLESSTFIKSKIYKKGLDLFFEDCEFELGYCCDFTCLGDFLIFASVYFNRKFQKIIISFITFRRKNENEKVLLEKINEENIIYSALTRQNLINFSVKIVPETSVILFSFNENCYLFFFKFENNDNDFNKSKNEKDKRENSNFTSVLINRCKVKNHLNKVDFFIKNGNTIELIIADFDFKLMHFRFYLNAEILDELISIKNKYKENESSALDLENKNEVLNNTNKKISFISLISTFEKFFYSKVTDMKFIFFPDSANTGKKDKLIPIQKECQTIKPYIQNNKSFLSFSQFEKKQDNKKQANNKYISKSLIINKTAADEVKNQSELHNESNQNFQNCLETKDSFSGSLNEEAQNLYFCVCSRDGYFRIFSLSNNRKEIFKYKSSELWITSINYSLQNKLFFLTVNSNEKIIGIKFFEDKEFLVKRIPMTENSIGSFYCGMQDNLFFLDDFNNVNLIKCSHFESLFKNYKTRCRKNYNAEKIFEFKNLNCKVENKDLISDSNNVKTGNKKESSKNNCKEIYSNSETEIREKVLNNEKEETFFVLNDEVLINEKEDKIFSFKILNNYSSDLNAADNGTADKKFVKNYKKMFVLNRLNRVSIFYD